MKLSMWLLLAIALMAMFVIGYCFAQRGRVQDGSSLSRPGFPSARTLRPPGPSRAPGLVRLDNESALSGTASFESPAASDRPFR
jgi:hypothetical protein